VLASTAPVKKYGTAASESIPCAVTHGSDDWLNQQTRYWSGQPQVRQ
jgi:hypothetical protein